MKKRLPLIALLTLLYGVPAFAMTITDSVLIDGREWAQPDLFLGSSWDDINAICPGGVCGAGSINNWDMAGWTWATNGAVINLINPYVYRDGGRGDSLLAYPSDNYDFSYQSAVANDFFNETGLRPTDTYHVSFCGSTCYYSDADSYLLQAWTSTWTPGGLFQPRLAASAGMLAISNEDPFSSRAWNNWQWSNDDTSNVGVSSGSSNNGLGGWFYRAAATDVPVPGTFALLTVAVLILFQHSARNRTLAA